MSRVAEHSAGRRNGVRRRRIGVVLAVVGLFASVVGLLAINRAADAFYAGMYADCPPVEWSQALLTESQVIAEVPNESAGYYSDCDGSGVTNLFIADSPEDGQCAAIVERAAARGWSVIHQTAPCETVMSRDLDGRTAWLTLSADRDENDGRFGLAGEWHRQDEAG